MLLASALGSPCLSHQINQVQTTWICKFLQFAIGIHWFLCAALSHICPTWWWLLMVLVFGWLVKQYQIRLKLFQFIYKLNGKKNIKNFLVKKITIIPIGFLYIYISPTLHMYLITYNLVDAIDPLYIFFFDIFLSTTFWAFLS